MQPFHHRCKYINCRSYYRVINYCLCDYRNGPDGSILCVYTFDGEDDDLDGIFSQKYLEQMGSNEWVAVSNPNPVSVRYLAKNVICLSFCVYYSVLSHLEI